MNDEIGMMTEEYDNLLVKLNEGKLSLDEAARIQSIEDEIARLYGYDWAQQYLHGEIQP